MLKPKINLNQQITHMRDTNGIKFSILSEEHAKNFLETSNYFFKLKSYAKNYEKYNLSSRKQEYINLEYAYLVELSTIDMHLRRLIIRMTLDIEHFLKTQLLRDISNDASEDGYSIVQEMLTMYPYIKDDITRKKTNSACKQIILKHENNMSVWHFVEVVSFGDFIKLYKHYNKKNNRNRNISLCLTSVQFLRNAAAHNSCLINKLKISKDEEITPSLFINTYVSKIEGVSKETRKKRMKNSIIHDFITTLYVFDAVITSGKIKQCFYTELNELFSIRMKRNKDYFTENGIIISTYKFVNTVVDFITKKCDN